MKQHLKEGVYGQIALRMQFFYIIPFQMGGPVWASCHPTYFPDAVQAASSNVRVTICGTKNKSVSQKNPD
jgi:hypothetical protein